MPNPPTSATKEVCPPALWFPKDLSSGPLFEIFSQGKPCLSDRASGFLLSVFQVSKVSGVGLLASNCDSSRHQAFDAS